MKPTAAAAQLLSCTRADSNTQEDCVQAAFVVYSNQFEICLLIG